MAATDRFLVRHAVAANPVPMRPPRPRATVTGAWRNPVPVSRAAAALLTTAPAAASDGGRDRAAGAGTRSAPADRRRRRPERDDPRRRAPSWLRALALVAGLALLPACAGSRLAETGVEGLPARAEVTGVPFFPQAEGHCGPAALAMVLAWTGRPVSPATTAPVVFTPGRGGTFGHDVVAAARREGVVAVPLRRLGDVFAEVAAGHPVMVLQNLGLSWWPVWHFAVIVGYDLQRGEVMLHSGTRADDAVPLATFQHTWHRGGRWALVVLPAGRLPASAPPPALVEAALGLERAGQPAAAAETYQAILGRWPGRRDAGLGLGNARYAAGEYAAAAAAFEALIRADGNDAVAWNNLTHVRAEQRRHGEALAAARRAVALAGPHLATSRTTLAAVIDAAGVSTARKDVRFS